MLLRANNIQSGELVFDDVQYVDCSKVKPNQLLRKGDILICASSGSKCLVGKAALVREDMPVTFGAFCCVLRTLSNESDYLGFYFQSKQYRRAIEQVCSGSNINNLKADNFYSLDVPFYVESERGIISAQFSSIVSQSKRIECYLASLDTLVKSRFVEMFGGGSLATRTIGELATDIRYGTSKKSSDEGRYTYLRMNNMTDDGRLDFADTKRITLDGSELDKCLVRKGDLLFNRTNSREKVGKTAVFEEDEPMVIAGYIIRVRLGPDIRSRYLCAYMNLPHVKEQLRAMAKGAVHQANINAKQLCSIQVPVPRISQQDEFISFVSRVDKLRFVATGIVLINPMT